MTTFAPRPGGTFPLSAQVTVNRVGFGAMQLAGPGVFGPPADRDRAIGVLRRAVELGIDHIDTSDFYGPWVVNELIAEALHPYRDVVVATKIGAYRDHRGGWLPSGHPDSLRAQVHDNLRRLRVDSLDLVYLRHMGDGSGYGLADQLGALAELREQGLVRLIGLSNVEVEHLEQAREITPISAVQNRYNVVDRGCAALLDRTTELELAFVPFFPLGSGFTASQARDHAVLRAVAERVGATPAQVALAWLLHHAANVLLIPGTSTPEHLEENTAAGRVELSPEDIEELGAIVAEGESLEGEAH
ncbi:oxidoreductase [Saccharopolyspora cebuensis]|uniref:Oxidoreductase n=1 Tax=Saccharopolyspora cebuensis TaxID=418759 RepID=A0ABV4CJL5_9PSEU